MKSGQILIIVLLVVVVALAVGLSVASRNITNLRTSTQTEHSQRAFDAAEGGVEDVLSRLSDFASNPAILDPNGLDESVDVGDISATVNIKGEPFYESTVELGSVRQEDLDDGAVGVLDGNSVTIYWAKIGAAEEEACPASIEYTLINNNGGNYTQSRGAISGGCSLSGGQQETGFLPSGTGCSQPDPIEGFQKCTVVPVDSNAEILRIKPFWNKTTFKVVYNGDSGDYPVQVYRLESEANTDLGVTRRIEVLRTKEPQLPTAFDYVLYSEQDIVK